jgi:hypothetical protein
LLLSFIACLCFVATGFGATREPFSMGYGMGNAGAIIQQKGLSGRQPWTAACFYNDTLRYGASLAGVDYYDPMDNMESSHITQVAFGAWYAWKGCVAKASFAHFNALGVYFEQQGHVSLGCNRLSFVNISIEADAFRAGLNGGSEHPQTRLGAGFSLLVPARVAAFSLCLGQVPLKNPSVEGYDAPVTLRLGLHTAYNSLGGQGILADFSHDTQWNFRVSIAEEYRLMNSLALCAALSTNPMLIHFGVTVALGGSSLSVSFVDHPVLGWSRGLDIDYAGK